MGSSVKHPILVLLPEFVLIMDKTLLVALPQVWSTSVRCRCPDMGSSVKHPILVLLPEFVLIMDKTLLVALP
ncbi:hypothetical protein HGM15179_002222, partial [Zosterops borbonicus]